MPFNRGGYCGFYTYSAADTLMREFIGAELVSPLDSGQKYYISFKVSQAELVNCSSNKIGVLFTTSITNPFPVHKNFAHFYTDSIITDTSSWSLLSGSFLADSSYRYIIIGNFFNNTSTDTIMHGSFGCGPYYYIDDICVSIDSLTCVDISNQIIDINASNKNIQKGDCISFHVDTIVDYDFYNWQFEGATPDSYTGKYPSNICYGNTGIYPVTFIGSDSSGCKDTISKKNYITVQEGNIVQGEEKGLSQIQIFPNPTRGSVYVGGNVKNKISIHVYNIWGDIIEELGQISLSNNYRIDLTEHAKGLYFVSIRIGEVTAMKKIILIE